MTPQLDVAPRAFDDPKPREPLDEPDALSVWPTAATSNGRVRGDTDGGHPLDITGVEGLAPIRSSMWDRSGP